MISESLKHRTVMVKCVAEPGRPSYFANGVAQEMGDRARFPIAEAKGLERAGKAVVIPNSEEIVSQGMMPSDPPRSSGNWPTKW